MRAAVCRAYGPPEVVAVDTIDAPDIGSGQARVREAMVHCGLIN